MNDYSQYRQAMHPADSADMAGNAPAVMDSDRRTDLAAAKNTVSAAVLHGRPGASADARAVRQARATAAVTDPGVGATVAVRAAAFDAAGVSRGHDGKI